MAMEQDVMDYVDEKAKIRNFLTTYTKKETEDGEEVKAYANVIEKLAKREQVEIFIEMDDVEKFDPGLLLAIEGNAKRYHQLFSDVIDSLIMESIGDKRPPVKDALDAFIFQRIYMDKKQKELEIKRKGVNKKKENDQKDGDHPGDDVGSEVSKEDQEKEKDVDREKSRKKKDGEESEAGDVDDMLGDGLPDRQKEADIGDDDRVEVDMEELRARYPPQLLRRFEVFFKCRSVEKPLAVREIKAIHVGKLVTLIGIVIRATEVKPMVSVLTYTCDTCGSETYQPVAGTSFMPVLICPSKDCTENKTNGRLQMQIRGSKFMKFQDIRIQELSDQVPVGSVPRSVNVNVFGENTRACVPGDIIRVTGVYTPMLRSGFRQLVSGLTSEVYLEAHHIENFNANDNDNLIESDDLNDEEVEMVAQDNFYELLAYSIAPEIFGHRDVKKSLVCALVGGVDRTVVGMKVRGCINVLLMGDPGVAKSQLLSYVDRLALRSQYTTGRGSSGVGLTASVMKDPITGEMVLEGGALVLADRGICCIDEFDKMMDTDRTAIHEVMEQQTISIAKAGIMTTLNARVTIIAAANPAFGRYNPKRSIEHNINLPAALISRFDLIWLIQDKPDRDNDRRLAEHITFVHMNGREPEREGMKPIEMKLIRRYIAICKRKQPIVGQDLRERLVELYVELRKDARTNKDSTFISPRSLLAVIRIGTALARLRLSDYVESCDVEEAIRLLESCQSSIRAEQPKQYQEIEPLDEAFNVIRDLYQSIFDGRRALPVSDVIKKCANRGIGEDVVKQCIDIYTANGVLMLDRQHRIVFTVS